MRGRSMTELMYLRNPQLFEAEANITFLGSDERGDYIVLDKTPFYPQGGGQPSDEGKLHLQGLTYQIHSVRIVEKSVRHYMHKIPQLPIQNLPVKLVVDAKKRKIHSRYHTAGHLLSHVVEESMPFLKAVKGHQFPGEAYIEFLGDGIKESSFADAIREKLEKAIAANFSVQTFNLDLDAVLNCPTTLPQNKELRACKIGHYKAIPCGGTHVSSLFDLISVVITRIKTKKDRVKISYEVVF